jgi:hypothetical protein
VPLSELGPEVREPCDLTSLAVGLNVDIEVYPVLRPLGLGNLPKKNRGSTPCGSRQAATSRNAERPLMVTRLTAGMRPSATIRFHAGPVFVDRAYRVTGEVVALSRTPKTEVLWFDSRALDDAGTLVAEMRMMLRQMKQSSPLYAE